MTLHNIIEAIIKVIFSTTIIGLIIWNRFFRLREPQIFKDLLNDSMSIYTSINLSILFLFLLIAQINNLTKKNDKEISFIKKIFGNKNVQIMLKWINTLKDSPIYIYENITGRTRLAWLIEQPASYLVAYFNYPRFFVISFYFAPQLIVASIFLFESCCFDQKIYFFVSLNLLIIYLLAKVIIFVLQHYSLRRMKHFQLFLDIKQEPGNLEFALKHPNHMPNEIPFETVVNKYTYMCQFWFVYYLIYLFICEINTFNSKYISWIRIYVFTCFFIGWLYLLLYLTIL